MTKIKRGHRAKINLLDDHLMYIKSDNNKKTILKAEKRSRESHGKYKPSSDSTS